MCLELLDKLEWLLKPKERERKAVGNNSHRRYTKASYKIGTLKVVLYLVN
jgi:hypothetical protein